MLLERSGKNYLSAIYHERVSLHSGIPHLFLPQALFKYSRLTVVSLSEHVDKFSTAHEIRITLRTKICADVAPAIDQIHS